MGFSSFFQHYGYSNPALVFGPYLELYTSFHHDFCFAGKLRDGATTLMKRVEANFELSRLQCLDYILGYREPIKPILVALES